METIEERAMEKYWPDDFYQKTVEKISAEVVSYITEQIESAINEKQQKSMKTIEERAKEFAMDAHDFDCEGCDTCSKCRDYRKFVDIVTEQKAIDIEKAKTAFNKACGWLSTYPWYNEVFEEFIKNMEE